MKTEQDKLKEAMLKYAPELANDYENFMLKSFKNMIEELGEYLKGVYSNTRWHRIFSNMLQNKILKEHMEKDPDKPWTHKIKYTLDKSQLKKAAKRYGEVVALEWYYKMSLKLGKLEDVKVSPPDNSGEVTIDARHGNDKVHVDQHRIINYSHLGTPFHQFPARIYVNGKFTSEAQYKGIADKWGIREPGKEKPVTLYKCESCGHTNRMFDFKNNRVVLSCPKCKSTAIHRVAGTGSRKEIDVNSRPKSYHFTLRRMIRPNDWSVNHESAKGLTEDEAWNKIIRQYKRWHEEWHGKGTWKDEYVTDKKLTAIYAWNNRLLWKASSGTPIPKEFLTGTAQVKQAKTTAKKKPRTPATRTGIYGTR